MMPISESRMTPDHPAACLRERFGRQAQSPFQASELFGRRGLRPACRMTPGGRGRALLSQGDGGRAVSRMFTGGGMSRVLAFHYGTDLYTINAPKRDLKYRKMHYPS